MPLIFNFQIWTFYYVSKDKHSLINVCFMTTTYFYESFQLHGFLDLIYPDNRVTWNIEINLALITVIRFACLMPFLHSTVPLTANTSTIFSPIRKYVSDVCNVTCKDFHLFYLILQMKWYIFTRKSSISKLIKWKNE